MRGDTVFADVDGRSLPGRTAVSEITERLWPEYEMFATRELSEFEITYCLSTGLPSACIWASSARRCG